MSDNMLMQTSRIHARLNKQENTLELTVQNFMKYCKTVAATNRQYSKEYIKNRRKNL